MVSLEKNKIYEVLDLKHGCYKIMTEVNETYYIPQNLFEVLESQQHIKMQVIER